jgi:hypothetical protein
MSLINLNHYGGQVKTVEDDNIIDKIETTNKNIYSIVLTGGPSGGKSTIVGLVKKYFNKYNANRDRREQILVLVLNETATSLINQGVSFTPLEPELFQKLVLSNQISMENTIYEYAENLSKYYDKVVILLDRGLLDGKAYLIETNLDEKVEQKWNTIIDKLNLREEFNQHIQRYDLIIHIVTAAEGTGFFYTTENNTARTETAEEARDIDAKTLTVWEKGVNKPVYLLDNREGIVCRQGKGVQIIKMISKLIQKPYINMFLDVINKPSDPITRINDNGTQVTFVGGYLKYKSKYIALKNKIGK